MEARVIYDFSAQNADELNLQEGDIIHVVSQNVGNGFDGWWMGRNSSGQEGLIPENFVELLSPPEPSMPPPPPPPPKPQQQQQQQQHYQPYPDWQPQQQQQEEQQQQQGDQTLQNRSSAFFADESWSSDDEQPTQQQQQQQRNQAQQHLHTGSVINLRGESTGMRRSASSTLSTVQDAKQDWRKTLRYLPKVPGIKEFLLYDSPIEPTEADAITVVHEGKELVWTAKQQPFTCKVTDPSKASKMRGLKSFIAYNISTSLEPNLVVARRYKQFDWLYKQLVEKFPCVAVPPLPDKQVTGRYEENFINTRMRQLQCWMNRMSLHPAVGPSMAFQHFVTCSDDSKRWKEGKRRAEQDKMSKGWLYHVIVSPQVRDWGETEKFTDGFDNFIVEMDRCNKEALDTMLSFGKKCENNISKEYARVANAFAGLDKAMAAVPREALSSLSHAMKLSSRTYNEVSELWNSQHHRDSDPLSEQLHEYCGLLSAIPSVVSIGKSASLTARECSRGVGEGRVAPDEAEETTRRAGVIANAQFAEMVYFQRAVADDYQRMMQSFLKEQIRFHQEVAMKLQSALDAYSF